MGKLLIDLKNKELEHLFHFFSKYAKVCVVDFYADWCGPCKKLSNQLEETISNQSNIISHVYVFENINQVPNKEDVKNKVVFLKINIDNFEDLSHQFKVQSIPYVVFYKNGKLQSDIARTSGQIYDAIEKLL